MSVDIWMRKESYLQRAYWQKWLCHLESRLTTCDQLFATKSCLSSTSTPSFAVGKTKINGGWNLVFEESGGVIYLLDEKDIGIKANKQ